MLFASLSVGTGIIYFSGAQSIWQFFVGYIVVRAIAGPNLQNLIPRTIAVNFFEKKRNFAMGITSLNRIIGESINIQVITAIATSYSWRTAYKAIGFVSIPLSLPIFLLIRHKPEDVGQLPDGDLPGNKDSINTDTVGFRARILCTVYMTYQEARV